MRALITIAMLITMNTNGMAQQFGSSLPQVGRVLPNVTAYDENGGEFSLNQLRGKYAVLVFGCLT